MKLPFASMCFALLFFAYASVLPQIHAETPTLKRLGDLGSTVKESGGTVVDLRVDCSKLTDADYKLIGSLKSLKTISISGKPMLDRHLALLSGLSELEGLQINGTQLTDEGYRHFAAFQNLRRLSLFHPSRDVSEFTGQGLAHLKSLPNLRRLTFAGATAGDAAFKAVGELTQLEEFSQWHNWESPAAIGHITGLPLKRLKMGQRLPNQNANRPASLDDATLAEIAKMGSLEVFDLQEARLSYAGIVNLKGLKHLKTIKLKWVDITQVDVEKLRKDMPQVVIEWEPLTEEEEQSLLVKKLKL